MATLKQLEKRDKALEQITKTYPMGSVKAAFLSRQDISVLSTEEQESLWAEHERRVQEFFKTIAGMDPIFVQDNRMPQIMIEEGIDTTDIPEVRDWSGAVVGKFYRGK